MLCSWNKRWHGNINHTTTSVVSSTVIMNDTKQAQAAWKFLKWYHKEETH